MMNDKKSLYEFTFEELDKELIARGTPKLKEQHFQFACQEENQERNEIMDHLKKLYAGPPSLNIEMKHICTRDIVTRLKEMSRGCIKNDTEEIHNRGIVEDDDRMDFYEFEEVLNTNSYPTKTIKKVFGVMPGKAGQESTNSNSHANMEKIRKNLDATAVLCCAGDLQLDQNFAGLKVTNFKKKYNLCECERFANQFAAQGEICTCFLVKKDIIATAGHFLNNYKVEDLRILFGFKMANADTAVTKVPITNVYKGVKIIAKNYKRGCNEPDWGLVKLDRKVEGHEIIKFTIDDIYCGQPVYTLGHPCGLPLKFAAGASVYECANNAFFRADLDIFMGNSGSPVFDMETHELLGLVARGYPTNFRFFNDCWISVIYPAPNKENKDMQLSECTRASTFMKSLVSLED